MAVPLSRPFQNAFLAVLIPEVELLSGPKLKRGRRFDWLYEQIAPTGRLELTLSKKLYMPGTNSGSAYEPRRTMNCGRLVLATAAAAVAALGKTGT
jgi:hypothetical protein